MVVKNNLDKCKSGQGKKKTAGKRRRLFKFFMVRSSKFCNFLGIPLFEKFPPVPALDIVVSSGKRLSPKP